MVEGLFKYLEKSKEKKNEKEDERARSNTPVKKAEVNNSLFDDSIVSTSDNTRTGKKSTTPQNNYNDIQSNAPTSAINDDTRGNAPTVTVPNAYAYNQGNVPALPLSTTNNVQSTPPNNNPFNNPQNMFNNNFPNTLLTNIYSQLQRLTDSISQSRVPPRTPLFKMPVVKRKKLSAFTEPYRMNDYEAVVEEKRKKTAAT
ncbi:hypothetical protein THOM_2171 [Trachipleistophora hominis]|uniref:Uncharacterized protein n=1 Tax=Trachipleistophora hominis TaxID=72359 RepID=L7JUE0_TRAHO|nr:hypothetical protein THOM_2171 [Trachipleistophora hominis]